METVDLLIVNSQSIATMNDERQIIRDGGWIGIRDGIIVALGNSDQIPPPAEKLFDATGCLMTPGLVNSHQHLYQNLTRSMKPNGVTGLTEWFWTYFPMWKELDEEAIRTSVRLGLFELALSGCTTATDHEYIHPFPFLMDAVIEEAVEVGMRIMAVRGSMTLGPEQGGVCLPGMEEDEEDVIADCIRLIEKWHDPKDSAMVQVALGPSNLMSSTETVFTRSAEIAKKYGVRLHTHIADDPDETEYVLEHFGKTPLEVLESLGWFTKHTWCAHVVYPSNAEMVRLAASGVSVAHCPSATVIDGGLPGGPTPVRDLLNAGVNVGIGCDGATAGDHQSMWMETKTALLLSRLREGTVQAMTAMDALWLATRGSAKALGREGNIGQLTLGANADIATWKMDGIAYAGSLVDDVTALLQGGPAQVWSSWVGGVPLVQEGKLVGVDVSAEVSRHSKSARRLQAFSQ
jgi:cytosine/adenosine deaminase-related metal-dependent hydrolase